MKLSEKSWIKKIKPTVGLKLTLLLVVLLVSSVAGLVTLVNRLFIEDATATLYQINSDAAGSVAGQVREVTARMVEQARMSSSILLKEPKTQKAGVRDDIRLSGVRTALMSEVFGSDASFRGVIVVATGREGMVLVDEEWVQGSPVQALNGTTLTAVEYLNGSSDIFKAAFRGESSLILQTGGYLGLVFPVVQDLEGRISHVAGALFTATKITEILALSGQVTTYLVDREGRLLLHSDPARSGSLERLSHLPVVSTFLEGKMENGQTRYLDPDPVRSQQGYLLSAFRSVGFAGMGAFAEVPESKAFEVARTVVRRSVILAVIFLGASVLVGTLFSSTLTRPIRELALAAKEIAAGKFDVRLKPRSKDEVGELSLVFNEMASGLAERDRVKEVFNKFHNKEIAEKLLRGEVKLGGEKYDAVVFFSDIRGFTSLSETMTPTELVEMLNEYMTRMVRVIREHQGIVDKFVGDAIMGVWGVPFSSPWDSGLAVRACLSMREELDKLNELRISRGQVPLKIGMGLNCGPLVAGNIGSEEKMEFTVIGDTVNTASRLESMTKAYGTDLLISESVWKENRDDFFFEECEAGKVKGKADALRVFKVKGYLDPATKEPILIETPYSTYAAEKSDKVESVGKKTEGDHKEGVPPPFRLRSVA